MVIIDDGKGTGRKAEVNDENQLVVKSTVQSELEHESEENGAAYNWGSDAINIDANDTVLLVKNTSDNHLHIERIEISGDATSEYTIHLPTVEVTVTAGSGGGVVTGTNLNTASSNVADASAASDETNNAQGNILNSVHLLANTTISMSVSGLILGKNKSVGIDRVSSGTASVSIVGHFED